MPDGKGIGYELFLVLDSTVVAVAVFGAVVVAVVGEWLTVASANDE